MTLILASASPRRRELLSLLGLPFEVHAAGIGETPHDGEPPVEYVRRVAREKAEALTNPAPLPQPAGPLRGEGPTLAPWPTRQGRLPQRGPAGAPPATPLARSAGRGRASVGRSVDYRNPLPTTKSDRSIIIACDTEVVIDGAILGKPRDGQDAIAMLKRLRGRTHEVISAVSVVDPHTGQCHEEICRSEVPMRQYSDAEIEAYVATGDPLDKAGAYAIQHDEFHPSEGFAHCYASVMGLPLCHLVRLLRKLGRTPANEVPSACQQFNRYQCPVYREIGSLSK